MRPAMTRSPQCQPRATGCPRRWWIPVVLCGVAALLVPGVRANPSPPGRQEAPQSLPLSARWCLDAQRCILLEEPVGERQMAIGLQLRPPLPPLRGMWFRFSPPTPVRFWMHRTPSPLDMLFVRDRQVVAISAAAQPCMHLPCPTYGIAEPVDGVLELAAGQAQALGITIGTPVRIVPVSTKEP